MNLFLVIQILLVLAVILLPIAAVLTPLSWMSLLADRGPGRRMALAAALLLLAFVGGDWLIGLALPAGGYSYGWPGSLPLTLLGFRALVLILTAAVFKYTAKLWPGMRTPRAAGLGLGVAGLLNLGVTLFIVQATFFEPFDLQVTHQPLDTPAFLPDRPLRILHLTDLHVERITRREQEMLAEVQALRPDLIVLTGDYLNSDHLSDEESIAQAHRLLGQLAAPYGVYAVSGNVDRPWFFPALFEGTNVVVLEDKIAHLEFEGGDLYLIGVGNMRGEDDGQTLAGLTAQVPAGAYRVLLYHKPDLFDDAASQGVDLQLSGHTHGGQVDLFLWSKFLETVGYTRKYPRGLYSLEGAQLYVSRGIGMEGLGLPRLRYHCPPEIVVLELGSAGPDSTSFTGQP